MQAITTKQITAGIDHASQERQEAQRTYDRAALAYARNREGEGAKQALVDAKSRLDMLDGELSGLSAARSEASRQDAQDAVQSRVADVERWLEKTEAAISALPPAVAKVDAAVCAFATAFAELNEAEIAANELMANAHKRLSLSIPDGPRFLTRHIVDSLVWLHTREQFTAVRAELIMDDGGTPTPDGPERMIKREAEREIGRARTAAATRITRLRAESADLQAKPQIAA